jgi:hypothetical protein
MADLGWTGRIMGSIQGGTHFKIATASAGRSRKLFDGKVKACVLLSTSLGGQQATSTLQAAALTMGRQTTIIPATKQGMTVVAILFL